MPGPEPIRERQGAFLTRGALIRKVSAPAEEKTGEIGAEKLLKKAPEEKRLKKFGMLFPRQKRAPRVSPKGLPKDF